MVERVLVAGGGIGGLAVATALRLRGIDSVVLEQSPQFTETGSGVVLSPNGMKAADWIAPPLAEGIRSAGSVFGAATPAVFSPRPARPWAR
ncbi:FAD-dependent monooxygenase [Streptomyces sp. ISL-94]|uniref:FAD-dependent monooxygenase n=1 Tax=Streptomyces sp. ISL-94 TaxID=2819190 RepID=UPI001BE79F0E|nr:FAD-dependent monooxygenase [Streptomyces sp. ISL-94]MBT2481987.1 FAD-dependent monooxygenase [Streptomyces sp. ISL-94]